MPTKYARFQSWAGVPSMRLPTTFTVLVAVLLASSGCTLTRGASAWMQSKASFVRCTADSRVLCEPGAEAFAKSVVGLLPDAVSTVEKAQFAKFTSPIVIYAYATRESFSRHTGVGAYADGVVTLGALHLSPKLLSTPERTKGILVHELSHLNLWHQMGWLSLARLPNWFSEGLATYVSAGGGAETVLSDQAVFALRHGRHFEPEDTQWALFPKGASSYRLDGHMYYRQAALFVAYIRDRDPQAFKQMLVRIEAREAFAEALEASYHQPLQALWQSFLLQLPASTALAAPARQPT